MIAIPIPWNRSKWNTMSFTSTLYLCPVLDLLLVNVPPEWQAEVRLGLQEALVNAAKHGNKLDPSKTIIVKFTVTTKEYSWVIVDEGAGFIKEQECEDQIGQLPIDESENGRGISILHEIFDCVHWNREGTQLTLSKTLPTVNKREKQPSIC
ncbi:putative anti-sigma regulatory factor serine/threonine protein kinase [Chondrocystis sp. NIES-4102]|nr:putative anti-sigma regulatory factor serine/threonine protein kinase [Chondrocystis sp. NIES-4102]